ncbi:aminopeptidase P family protein [Nakamurella flavida]|uniref:Aminopeptidase P family protein n=1 Tax=Nakamurella flavida TaxID=363630 RepID=A0A938YJ68_9ACTN|nr:Xaa-Pro peptidase family protein [Nakamurella flavida]MBM9476962.1 aminopeptidase P family protein [Nakamurella flavida]MDP9779907.1 Xaa-Pro dipeptidase [Nakamurella flavida]
MTPPAARRARLRDRLAREGLDALLVTDLINLRYLTGFTGSNGALLITAGGTGSAGGTDETGTVFCTDGRYLTQSAAQVPDLERVIDRPVDVALLARASGRVGFEAGAVTVAQHAGLVEALSDRAGAVELTDTRDLVEELRVVKDDGEIDALRRACAVADRALAELIAAGGLRPGRTEREVGLDLDQRMRVLGAADPAFETIVAAGANGAVPHHRPDATVLAAGDLVTLDFGAVIDGYHSDMTRTLALGRVADWQRDLYDLVARSQQAGREAVRPGVSGAAVDAVSRAVIVDAGQGEFFLHGLGHGVGLQVHEAPGLAASATGTMSTGMCVTVEPGVYLAGRGGVRIEDSGVVRPDGYEVLTTTSRELIEV